MLDSQAFAAPPDSSPQASPQDLQIISEMGVSGSADYQTNWLTAAANSMPNYPDLIAAVYFEDVNPHINQLATGPDWRITGDALSKFVNLP